MSFDDIHINANKGYTEDRKYILKNLDKEYLKNYLGK